MIKEYENNYESDIYIWGQDTVPFLTEAAACLFTTCPVITLSLLNKTNIMLLDFMSDRWMTKSPTYPSMRANYHHYYYIFFLAMSHRYSMYIKCQSERK